MTPLEKFREQVQIAKDSSTYVVLTAEEGEAILHNITQEIDRAVERAHDLHEPEI